MLHVFLTLNLGILIALLVPMLFDWASHPTELVSIGYGVQFVGTLGTCARRTHGPYATCWWCVTLGVNPESRSRVV